MPGVGDAGRIESQGSETVKIASSVAVHQEEVERLLSLEVTEIGWLPGQRPALLYQRVQDILSSLLRCNIVVVTSDEHNNYFIDLLFRVKKQSRPASA